MVQIFLEEELVDIAFDANQYDEWKEKVDSLNLSGQRKLTETKSLVPFPPLSKTQLTCIEAVCPNYENVENFSFSVIPLEVIQELHLCQKEDYFTEYTVRYSKDNGDPFLLGKRLLDKPDKYGYFLIARWGAEKKLNWDELYAAAKKRLLQDWKARLESKISLCKGQLERLDADVVKRLNGDWVYCEA
jgi:hypothetical protein